MRQPPQVRCDPVNSRIWDNIYNKDKNSLIFFCGGTGDCKSGSALMKAIELDRDYKNRCRFYFSDDPNDPKNQVVTSAQAFVSLVGSKLPKGSVILWDEIGVDADNREYHTLKNRLVKKVFQTFRYRNFIVLMTVPDFNSVDLGVRKLVHGFVEMQGQVFGGSHAKGKWQWVDTSPKTGKIYFKYPRWFDAEGVKKKLGRYYIPRPPADMEAKYKRLKDKVNRNWMISYKKQLKYMEEFVKGQSESRLTLVDMEKDVLSYGVQCIDMDRKRFSDVLLESKLDISYSRAKTLARYLNMRLRKGLITVEGLDNGNSGSVGGVGGVGT